MKTIYNVLPLRHFLCFKLIPPNFELSITRTLFLSPLAVSVFDRTLFKWILYNKIFEIDFCKMSFHQTWFSFRSINSLTLFIWKQENSHCSKKMWLFFVTVFYCWSCHKSFRKKGWGSQWKIFTSKFFKEIRIMSIPYSNPFFLYSKQER